MGKVATILLDQYAYRPLNQADLARFKIGRELWYPRPGKNKKKSYSNLNGRFTIIGIRAWNYVVLPFSEVVGFSERLCLFASDSEGRISRERVWQMKSMVDISSSWLRRRC